MHAVGSANRFQESAFAEQNACAILAIIGIFAYFSVIARGLFEQLIDGVSTVRNTL